MARERDPKDAESATLPQPDRLSVYTFANRYDALRLPLWIGLAGLVLVLLHLGLMWLYVSQLDQPDTERLRWYLISTFDLDSEESFGTYFSVLLLLFIGRLLWHQAKRSLKAREIWCLWWFMLAILFHLLSLEEVVDLHSMLNEHKSRQGGGGASTWRVDGFWAVMFIGASCVPFLWEMRWRFSIFALAGGLIYVLGALGVDAWTPEATRGKGDYLQDNPYYLWTALEEGLEIIGPLVFLYGLLALMAKDPRGSVVEKTEIEA